MIDEKLKTTPHKPGCYLMKDKNGYIIYVGKSKNLKNRLSSYFKSSHIGKTAMLVKDIYDFEYILTSSEVESLLLEINLIKKYTPKYNILYKKLIYKFTINELPPGFAVLSPKRTRTTFRSTDSEQALRLSSLTRWLRVCQTSQSFNDYLP